MRTLAITSILAVLSTVAAAGPVLDPTFGSGGIAPITAFGRVLALQPDGKIVVAGTVGAPIGIDLAIVRLLPDGTPDPTFGTAGRVVQDLGVPEERPVRVLIQADGRIVVALTLGPPVAESGAIARFGTGGALDPTFGTAGVVRTSVGSIEDAAFAAGESIVVAGNVLASSMGVPTSHPWIGRFDTTGAPDPSFGMSGVAELDRGATDRADAVVVDPLGRIVIGGSTGGAPFVVPPDSFFVARTDSVGAPDPTFGAGGVVVTDIAPGLADYIQDLVRQPDGKLVAAGTVASSVMNVSYVAVARWDDSGAPDNSFGVNGINAIGTGTEYGVAAALDAGGRLLVGGGTLGGLQAFVIRLTGGVLDAGWPFQTNQASIVTSVAVQPDGRVLALADDDVLRILTGDLCGNGVLDPGESCDDGNTTGGDCCSPTCFVDADGTSCSDGDACTTGDACAAGTCTGASVAVPTCMQCDASLGLVARPRTGCKTPTAPGRATLRITAGGERLAWRWSKGAATTPAELGDPLADPAATYDVCVFDGAGLVAASGASSNVAPDCARPPCWRRAADGGLTYRAAPSNAAGLTALRLRPGATGRASVRAKVRAPMLQSPTLPATPPLRVQVWARAGTCFDATYSAAGVRRSDAQRFVGASD